MQLTSLFVCLLTMAPVVIHAAPIPSSDLSLDVILFPEGELDLVKRTPVPAKSAAKPATKPAPVAAKPVAAPAKPPAKPAPAPAKPAPVPAKPAPAQAKPPATKPPPPAPVKNPPKPSTTGGTSKPGLGTSPGGNKGVACSRDRLSKRTDCSCITDCDQCTLQADCAFSFTTGTCVAKVNGVAPAGTIVGLGPTPPDNKRKSSPQCSIATIVVGDCLVSPHHFGGTGLSTGRLSCETMVELLRKGS